MDRYKAHQNLVKKFKPEVGKQIPNIRIFDRTVGLFYTKRGTPVKVGINGSSDCYAYYKTGNGIMIFDLEFKTGKAKQSKDQIMWQEFVESYGGLYIIVREDTQEAINRIKNYLNEKNIIINRKLK